MKLKNRLKAGIIFGLYLIATVGLLLWGYSVQKPAVKQQEFPFTITYFYDGKEETISDIFVGEYSPSAKYINDDEIGWFGYVKDKNRLELDYYTIADVDGKLYSINLNMNTGYLMGDSSKGNFVGEPEAVCQYSDGTNDIMVTEPAELKELGFYLVNWEYPDPIENKFSFGGVSLSSQAAVITSVIAVIALLAAVILIKKDPEVTYGLLDKCSIVVNFLMAILAFPVILVTSCLSEIVAGVNIFQQFLYLAPAFTALGIGLSVTLRRMGHKKLGFWIQFVGLAVYGIGFLSELF